MLVSFHALRALFASAFLLSWQFFDCRLRVAGVTVRFAVAVVVRPRVGECPYSFNAFQMMDVEVALVTGASLLAALLANGAFG